MWLLGVEMKLLLFRLFLRGRMAHGVSVDD